MRESLPVALKLMFGAEGGYSNRSTDAGGPTKYGITAKTLAAHRGHPVTAADVQALTLAEAQAIYEQSYWSQSGGDVLPVGLDYAAFDTGVMSGPNRAVKMLQQVVGVTPDGWIGEQTLSAVRDYPDGIVALIEAYCDARMKFLRSIKGKTGWATNGRGWTIRVTGVDPEGRYKATPGVVGNAIAMAEQGAPKNMASSAADAGGNSKAEPAQRSPWLNPEVILPGAGAALGGAGTLFSGTGPAQWALAGVIVVAGALGAWLVVQHMKANPK